jgi:hypothetical protein
VAPSDRELYPAYQASLRVGARRPLAAPPLPSARTAVQDRQEELDGCLLKRADSHTAPSEECARCHDRARHDDSHPVDLDYEASRLRSFSGLRSLGEAVRRGLFLPGGKLQCLTCHDGRSPWKHKLALPPGSRLEPAVDPADPTTYESPRALRAAPGRAPGADVARRPLCIACHVLE